MIFSYYYDTKKTHLINCGFDVYQIVEVSNNSYEVSFNLYIEEVKDKRIVKKEEIARTFLFSKSNDDERDDVEFIREKYADQGKWIFEIRNSKNSAQTAHVGLITESAMTNPIGLNICYNNDLYNCNVRANNLSAIEESNMGKKIRQTLLTSSFEEDSLPSGFFSSSFNIDTKNKIIELNDFDIKLNKDIPEETEFYVEMNIAPETTESIASNYPITEIKVENVGTLYVFKSHMIYVKYKDSMANGIFVPFHKDKTADDFYLEAFLPDSQLVLEGDGMYSISVRYAGKSLVTSYDPSLRISSISMRGGKKNISKEELAETEKKADSSESIKHKVGNINIFYSK